MLSLDKLDVQTGRFSHYPLLRADGSSLSGEAVWDIHQDESGRLWLGTGAGLSRFDPQAERFRHYSERDGLLVNG